MRTIIVETANRFARDLMAQETDYQRLKAAGISLIAADSPDQFVDETPTTTFIRQILGAVAQFDKAMTVARLRGARDRKRAKLGRCEGRKPIAEREPAATALARQLRQGDASISLRAISERLQAAGHVTRQGTAYAAGVVAAMLLAD